MNLMNLPEPETVNYAVAPEDHQDEGHSPNNSDGDSNDVVSRSRMWENINWSTTYSSDEESQGSSPSRCLFPDHLMADEEDGGGAGAIFVDGEEELIPPAPSPTAHHHDEYGVVFLMEPTPLVEPLVLVPSVEPAAPLYRASTTISTSGATTPPPPPQRTRRRTQSQNHGTSDAGMMMADPSRMGVSSADAVDGAPHCQQQQRPRHAVRNHHYPLSLIRHSSIPATRSLWVTVALVTTLLMFGGIHPGENTEHDLRHHSIRTNIHPLEHPDIRVSSIIAAAPPSVELSAGVPPLSNLASGRQPSQSSSSATSARFMYAVGNRNAPLTFRAPPTGAGGSRGPSESFLFHGMYVSLLVGIVLWSAREIHRELRERRRRSVRQESICDLL